MVFIDLPPSISQDLPSRTSTASLKCVHFAKNHVAICESLTSCDSDNKALSSKECPESKADLQKQEVCSVPNADEVLRRYFRYQPCTEPPKDRSEKRTSKNGNSLVRKTGGRKKINNANNNFVITTAEYLPRVKGWIESNVYNRIEVLAQPKPTPKGYKEEKEIMHWITKKPPPIPKAGFTTSVATPRVEELAKPMYMKGKWQGVRHCIWEEKYKHSKGMSISPDDVDWDRLATPRAIIEPEFNDLKRPVPESALQFQITKRLIKLSTPRKKINCGDFYHWLWNRKPDIIEMLGKVKRLGIGKTDLRDARIMLRCDLDFTEGKPIEQKIRDILPTLQYAFKKKARAVIITSHCGHPNGVKIPELSLERLMDPLKEALPENQFMFMDDCIGAGAIALCEDPEPGNIFLLQNLRFYPEEEGFHINQNGEQVPCTKEQIKKFTKILDGFYDVYVNDAFTLLHTDSSTNHGDPGKDRCFGLHVKEQLMIYDHFITNPGNKRMVAVLGGTYDQVADVVPALMGKASEIILGGELASMFLHALRGVDIGETECSPYHEKKIKDMMSRARDNNCVVNLPADLVVEHVDNPGVYFSGNSKDGVDDYYQIVDIGPLTRKCYQEIMMSADLLVWHGPMGVLLDGTASIALTFSEAYNKGIKTFLPDDDTFALFISFCPEGHVSYITENSEVTSALLHMKLPKGLSSLSPARKKLKRRPPKVVVTSTKPLFYNEPCMKMCNASDRLSIHDLDLKNKKVLIRSDLNVHVANGEVKDNYRLRMSIPSIRYALQRGARAVIVIGTLGTAWGKRVEELSLRPVAIEMARLLNISAKAVRFVSDPTLARVQAVLNDSHFGTVLVVENINFREEQRMILTDTQALVQKDVVRVAAFCEELTSMGDVYVNDAFSVLTTMSASVTGSLHRQRACGFLLKNELRYLSNVFNAPPRPFLVIIGGKASKSKFSALKSLLCETDELIITGELSIIFLKVQTNMPTGACNINPELLHEVPTILTIAKKNKVKVHYPVDFVVADAVNNSANNKQVSASIGVPDSWYAVDIGDMSCSLFKQCVKRNKLILWHGVAGVVAIPKFRKGSQTLLDIITTVSMNKETPAVSILSGHSTIHFVGSINPEFTGLSHVSTGGLAAMALISDKCMKPIHLLSSTPRRVGVLKLMVDQVELADKTVLLRAPLDIPVNPGSDTLTDNTYIKMLIPTIKYIQRKGARSITIVGMLGKPMGKKVESLSLLPAKIELEKELKQEVIFQENLDFNVASASGGRVYMVENLRFNPEEEGWETDATGERFRVSHEEMDEYRNKLGHLGEVYVNDSMPSLSTCDSSVVGVPSSIKVGGLLLKSELAKYKSFLQSMSTPFLFIVGSSGEKDEKLTVKLNMLYEVLDLVTDVVLCGNIAYNYIKVKTPNVKLGVTPFDTTIAKLWPKIMRKAKWNDVNFHTPIDFYVDEKVEKPKETVDAQGMPLPPPLPGSEEEGAEEVIMIPVLKTLQEGLGKAHRAMDIGPESVQTFKEIILTASNIVLMGPIGEYDQKDYAQGTRGVIDAICEAVTENETKTISIGLDTYRMLNHLGELERMGHVGLGKETCVKLLRNLLLPGLDALNPPPDKPMKKLSMERFNLSGKRALLRLDLDIPVVDQVPLDVSKIESALPTIRYLLDKEVKCVVLMGHRGDPGGYKNMYLSLEPLAQEFARYLNMTVNFLPYPCSEKTKELLEEPEPGSVFLMENLKFYPAEEGKEVIIKKKKKIEPEEVQEEGEGEEGEVKEEGEEWKELSEAEEIKEEVQGEGDAAAEGQEGGGEEEEEEEGVLVFTEDELTDEFVEFQDEENLDRVMYERMAPKPVKKYIEELSKCGDIFVNDDVQDLNQPLTSMTGFSCSKKMCGLLVKEFVSKTDIDVSAYIGVKSLSQAPREGEVADL